MRSPMCPGFVAPLHSQGTGGFGPGSCGGTKPPSLGSVTVRFLFREARQQGPHWRHLRYAS
jgi:hypothetical protein